MVLKSLYFQQKGDKTMYKLTLRAARLNRGYSVKRVAAITGISESTIRRIEKESGNAKLDKALLLLKLYGVSPDHVHWGNEFEYVKFITHTFSKAE